MKFVKTCIIYTFCIIITHFSLAQDSLNAKYNNMIESTETFNQYKVIPKTSLDAFWSEVMDSMQEDSRSIQSLTEQVQSQIDSIESLTSERNSVQNELDESLMLNDSISFLGITLSKSVYHIIVWGIIFVVLVLSIVVYLMFLKSNKVTTRSRKELETLQHAFEEHKSQSREKQVKLKRELQTAINTIDEMKRGRS